LPIIGAYRWLYTGGKNENMEIGRKPIGAIAAGWAGWGAINKGRRKF
jgi:hypothetical protein